MLYAIVLLGIFPSTSYSGVAMEHRLLMRLLCRYQYQNTALYDHVMELITASYYQLREKHGGGAAYASIAREQPVESDEDEASQQPATPPGTQHPAQQAHGRLPHSFVLKDTMQKMHAWLVCRALRSSYLPGQAIVDIMAERVQRLSDKRVTMVVRLELS